MANKQIEIERIMTKAVETAFSEQSEETLAQLCPVEDAVQSAIDGIDYSEVDGMTEKEAYDFYYEWASDASQACYKQKKSMAENDHKAVLGGI